MALENEGSGPVVTIFRSRLRPDVMAEYRPLAQHMLELARSMPGFVSFDSYRDPSGERVSVIVFADGASHAAWRSQPEHRRAQEAGRRRLYEWYQVQVCRLVHTHTGPPVDD
jgi:heme-degrading monooxygenase HmoA